MSSTPHHALRKVPTPWRSLVPGWFLGRPRTRHQHLDALDGLRGLAVLIVIGSHLSHSRLDLVPGLGLAGIGKAGVYLFFVLSAFLLTRAFLQRSPAELADTGLWADYALRRVLRIWPLYLGVLLVSWSFTRAGLEGWHYRIDTAALLGHLSLAEGQSVLWSIPVEFKFYLWLPLLAAGLVWMKHRRWPLPVEAVVAVLAVGLAIWWWPPAETGRNDVRLGPYLVLFLCGGLAARVDQHLRALPPGRGQWAWGLAGMAALLAFVATIPEVWSAITGVSADRRLSHHWFLFFAVIWSGLLLALLHGPGWLRAPFAWRPARLLGIVSFSAYLWHMPVLDGLRAAGLEQWPGGAWLAVGVVVLASAVSFLVFERPWRDVRLRRATAGQPV